MTLRNSYSANEQARKCPRKYQLERLKLSDRVEEATKENNVHMDFGNALGIGIQELFLHGNIDRAIVMAVMAYNGNEDFDDYGKCLATLAHAIVNFDAEWDWEEWELAYFNGKPAVELSFKIVYTEESDDYYCGYVDVILRNKYSGRYAVGEIKTTSSRLHDIDPMYKNSDQAMGYSLVLDQLSSQASLFDVLYIVVRCSKGELYPKLDILVFEKSVKDRLEWMLTQMLDYQRIRGYLELGVFPKYGGSCLTYNRPCNYYGLCDLAYWDSSPDAPDKPEEDWDFVFSLEHMIEDHLQR